MNARLMKEVEAERDMVTQLKATAKAAADHHWRDSEAAERAKAAEQESWAAKEIGWAKEKANLLEAYEKCQQGLERAVRKLKEERKSRPPWRRSGGLPGISGS